MLLLATATVSAAAGAWLCALDSGSAAASSAASFHEPDSASDECLFVPLAKVAVTPAVISAMAVPPVVSPAYVRALVSDHSYRIDPEPPVKPPAA